MEFRRFASFIVVGSLGFIVDGTILSLLVHVWDWGAYAARVLSFVPAVTATWYCNRRWVFSRTKNPAREYGAYVGAQIVGAAINLGTYVLVILVFPGVAQVPVVPLAVGSAAALGFNYAASSRWVFAATATARDPRH
jgi:putative flippase GtrA